MVSLFWRTYKYEGFIKRRKYWEPLISIIICIPFFLEDHIGIRYLFGGKYVLLCILKP
jgi:hypothetical protein